MQREAEEAARKAAQEPTEYACAACTVFNPIANATCEVCGTPAPSMDEIKRAAGLGGDNDKKSNDEDEDKDGDSKPKGPDPPHKKRLARMKVDLRRIISREQKRIAAEE